MAFANRLAIIPGGIGKFTSAYTQPKIKRSK